MNQPCAKHPNQNADEFRKKLRAGHSNDLVFAIVGQAGSGTSEIARQLEHVLNSLFVPKIVKASDVIREHDVEQTNDADGSKRLERIEKLQNSGDSLRKNDKSKISQLLLQKIVNIRQDEKTTDDANVWIVDTLRHPDEVRFFRSIYGESLFLVGVVCSHDERQRRLSHKFSGALPESIEGFMRRDEGDEGNSAGQQVAKAFQLADVYVDNTEINEISDQPNAGWRVPEDLRRFVDLVLQTKIIPPTMEETAMHAAYGAAMRSACLSRQVGAALVDKEGHLLATGCNDVPKPGGGLYGQGLNSLQGEDHRCFAFSGKEAYCRNNREQQEMIEAIADTLIGRFHSYFLADKQSKSTKRSALIDALQKSRITTLTEFSRAVHAEMNALLAAARQGISPVGASLFVTTFPCHNCARHIVVAGVREVQYIEPYRKSLATKLHDDAITISASEAEGGAKVLFRPFTGVAPRRYRQLFQSERELKNGTTGDRIRPVDPPPWGRPGQHIVAVQDAMEEFASDHANGNSGSQTSKGNGLTPGTNGSSGGALPPNS